jgi:histidine triad (HIT) family protein
MASIFSKIISGEIPCYKVAENEEFLSFLDIRPVVYGHTLVIPKKEINYYFDLGDDLLGRMNVFTKKVAKVLNEEVDCLRIGVMIAGLEVPHAHIHLIPINSISDLSFTNQRVDVSPSEMANLAKKLSASYKALNG